MNIFEKKAKYFKFFEDSKIVEIDQQNKRIAIIFFGKENVIHIFDSSPYLEYLPIEEITDDPNMDENFSKRDEKEDLHKLFHKMNLSNPLSSNDELGKEIIVGNQSLVKYRNFEFNFEAEKYTNLLSNKIQSNSNSIYSNNENNKINLNLKPNYNQKNIKFSLYKPKIKNKLLSVIECPSNIIIGVKWLNISQPHTSNGQEKIQNKLLLAVFDDGNLLIYYLKSQNYQMKTNVNKTKLQYIPYETFPEQWKIIGQGYTNSPIRDYYVTNNSNCLYTLHPNNFFIMWRISYIGDKISINSYYSINISRDQPVNKILIDKDQRFIFTFHNQCFQIFNITQNLPFPLIYTKKLNDLNIIDLCVMDMNSSNIKENNGNHKKNYRKKNEYTPINKVNDNFIEDKDDYAIFFNDIIDKSEDMKIYDINFFFNVQKPEFSLFEEFIIIPIYLIKNKQYVLLKFHFKEFVEKISDICYLEKSVKGENNEILRVLKVSHSPIVFGLSPSFYFKAEKVKERFEIKDYNCENVLNKPWENFEIVKNTYQPIALINEGIVSFYNLKNNSLLFEYELSNKKIINPDYVILSWTMNNTLLMSSPKVLMNVFKYCNEEEVLGVLLNSNKIAELMSI